MPPPSVSLKGSKSVSPMAAIRGFDELWLAQTSLALRKKRANLGCPIDQDAVRASYIEFDNIAVVFRESCEHLYNLWRPRPLIKSAQALALGAGWWFGHRLRLICLPD